jgi:general secretion pathway protein I
MKRGFTLLEVMVAMAILALGLSTILSSQTGLFATTRRVELETEAASLVRCKMSEIELELMENGFSLVDQSESGECCEDDDVNAFRCEWVIETVRLPDPPAFEENSEEDTDSDETSDPLSAGTDLASAIPTADGSLGQVGSVDDLAGSLAPSSGAEGGGIIGMALSMVYPSLKPMLEASIRKVKVKVLWNEGKKERSFEVIQYITNPLEGSLTPTLAEGLDTGGDTADGTDAGSTTGTSSSSTTGASTP